MKGGTQQSLKDIFPDLQLSAEIIEDTFDWFKEHPAYQKWIEWKHQDSGFLWIEGKRGSGKSVLSSFLLQDLSKQHRNPRQGLICYPFSNFQPLQSPGTTRDPVKALLGQLVTQLSAQLLQADPYRVDPVWTIFDRYWKEKDILSLTELQSLLSRSLQQILRGHNVTILVDALDEHRNADQKMKTVNFFRSILSQSPFGRLRVCWFSRNTTTLAQADELNICVDSYNTPAISKFVNTRLLQHFSKDSIPIDRLRDAIVERASGVFLWASLVVSMAMKHLHVLNDGKALEYLENLPSDLDSLYERIILYSLRSQLHSLASKILRWISFAARPLSLAELDEAMKEEALGRLSAKASDGIKLPLLWTTAKQQAILLQDCFQGLLDIKTHVHREQQDAVELNYCRHSTVHFVHHTVKEYLLQTSVDCFELHPESGSSEKDSAMAHILMARTCANYMVKAFSSKSRLGSRQDLSDKFPFLEYAALSWIWHLKWAETGILADADWQETFLWPSDNFVFDWLETCESLDIAWSWFRKHDPSFMLIACSCGLNSLISVALKVNPKLALAMDAIGYTPLSYAAVNGQISIIELLLEAGAPLDAIDQAHGMTPLHWAVRKGHLSVVRRLIDAGADINDGRSGTPALCLAAELPNGQALRTLLNHGADPNSTDRHHGLSALSIAISNSNFEATSALLQYGAEPNYKDLYADIFPIHHAVMSRDPGLVRYLIRYGANWTDTELLDLPHPEKSWVESILRYCKVDHDLKINMCPRAAQSSAQTSPFNAGSTTRCNKRQYQRADDINEDDQEKNSGSVKRSKQESQVSGNDKARRFACPYLKRDPQHYRNKTACNGIGFLDAHRVKDHLYKKHHLHICPNCGQEIQDHNEYITDHSRLRVRCTGGEPREYTAGLDHEQETLLKDRGLGGRGSSDEQKWKTIYKILFPDQEDGQIPDPYQDQTEEARLLAYEAYSAHARANDPHLLSQLGSIFGINSELLSNIINSINFYQRTQIQPRYFANQRQTANNGPAPVHDDGLAHDYPRSSTDPQALDLYEPVPLQSDRLDANGRALPRNREYYHASGRTTDPPDSAFFSQADSVAIPSGRYGASTNECIEDEEGRQAASEGPSPTVAGVPGSRQNSDDQFFFLPFDTHDLVDTVEEPGGGNYNNNLMFPYGMPRVATQSWPDLPEAYQEETESPRIGSR